MAIFMQLRKWIEKVKSIEMWPVQIADRIGHIKDILDSIISHIHCGMLKMCCVEKHKLKKIQQ